MSRDKMASVDHAWLRMGRPGNLMQIMGVLVFEGAPDFARVRATLETRLLSYARFRQRVDDGFASASWEDDPDFDLDHHFKAVILPPPGDLACLRSFVSELAAEPLNPARPLWDMHLVSGSEGVHALVGRIHHAIGDGIALMRVLLSLTDPTRDATPRAPSPAPAEPDEDSFWSRVFNPVTDAWLNSVQFSSKFWFGYLDLLARPGKAFSYARLATDMAQDIAGIALMSNDSPTRFKGKARIGKAVAWSEPLPLPAVKAVGAVLGCSINDLVLSAAAGALRGYLVEKGDEVDGLELRAIVPVNLRAAEAEISLGNRFGLVPLELPVGYANPLARLYETRRRMEALKHSYTAGLTLTLVGLTGLAPQFVQEQVLDLLANKGTAVMTNVPGPQQQCYMAGQALTEIIFWVPQTGDIGLGISIISYNGKVQFALMADRYRVPDPERVVARFAEEFEKLLLLVLMEPLCCLNDPAAVAERLAHELAAVPVAALRSGARRAMA